MEQLPDLKGLLSRKLDSKYEILSHSMKNLTALGDNYGSTMMSLTVNVRHIETGEEKPLELVAKMVPRDPMFFQMFQIPVSFPKESAIYTEVASELERHQDEYKVPESLRLDVICDCWGSRINLTGPSNPLDKDAVLVLENLKVQGFICGDRLRGLNQKDTEFVLRHLARFHAVPIAIRKLKPEVFQEKFMPALRQINMDHGMPEHMKNEMESYIFKTVKSIPEIEHLAEALEHQVKEGFKALNSDEQNRESPFNTICHRDFWMNNFMLRHDEKGNPEKIRIVDYQVTGFNTLVQDLLFFLFSSVENEVIEKNLDNLIEIYYNEFYWSLMTNGCPIDEFSWDSFLAELKEMAPYELSHILVMAKVLMLDSKKLDASSLEGGIPMDMIASDDLTSPGFYLKYKMTLLAFEKRNWLWKKGAH